MPTAKKLGRALKGPMEIAREKAMVFTLWIRVLSSCHDYLEISADTRALLKI